jgi:plastocyanin
MLTLLPMALLLSLGLIPKATTVQGQITAQNGKPAANAVIWLTGGNKKAEPLTNAVMDQRGKTFLPHVLVVTRGTKVAFPNSDTIMHNTYAQFEAKRFDLGLYPKGQVKYQSFDKTGVVAVRCNIHAGMSAYVVVVETPYYATTDAKGSFEIPNVAPGTYQLHVWHESGVEIEKMVVIKDKNEPLTLTLSKK